MAILEPQIAVTASQLPGLLPYPNTRSIFDSHNYGAAWERFCLTSFSYTYIDRRDVHQI